MVAQNVFKILFVCHGNICRSPMAEFIMKDIVAKAGISDEFYIESAAVSSEEIGNAVYPPVRRILSERGISTSGKTARKMNSGDYDKFDLIVGMDSDNIRRINIICGGDTSCKVHLLKEFSGEPNSDVADPWYTGDFSATLRDVLAGCDGILNFYKNRI